ncbi:hypothetical protein [Oceanobacillus sp. FSL W7-1293]|uniref:hypothetical protein n=1 Tax=Oceanobacillus sp. FSL W7-1293 TaxID=2921699 RepID=UPI0030CBC8B4
MNTFKHKRYWILMPPSLLISISLIIFIPDNKRTLYAFLVIALFWIVYYMDVLCKEKQQEEVR